MAKQEPYIDKWHPDTISVVPVHFAGSTFHVLEEDADDLLLQLKELARLEAIIESQAAEAATTKENGK